MIYWLFHDYQQTALLAAISVSILTLVTLTAYLISAGASIRTSAEGKTSGRTTLIRILNIVFTSLSIINWGIMLLGPTAIEGARGPQQSGIAETLIGPSTIEQGRALQFALFIGAVTIAINILIIWQTRHGSRFRLWLDQFRAIRRDQETHGSSHFANKAEFRPFIHNQQSGVNLYGKFMGQRRGTRFTYLGDKFCLNAEDAARGVITIGNPGSGKSSSVILPVLFDSMRLGQNLVVADPQLELTRHIVRYSAISGHRVIIHDPTNPKYPRFNIAGDVSCVTDARAVAEVLVPKRAGGGDDFWSKAAESLLAACLMRFDNLGDIFSAFSDLKALGEKLAEKADDAHRLASSFIASATGDRKLATNIVATLQQSLTGWADAAIRESTTTSDFDARMLVEEGNPTILILAAPGKHRRVIAPYLGAVLTKILLDLDAIGEQSENGELPLPIKFVIDEFPALGDLSAIVEFANLVRKRRIAFLLALQTMGQLESIYGRNGAETLLAGMAFQVVFGGCDQATASYYSRVAGKSTEAETDKETGRSISRSRELLTPDEIVRPPQGNCTIFGRYVTTEFATYVIVLARLTRIYERHDVKKQVGKADKSRLQIMPRGGYPGPKPKRKPERLAAPMPQPAFTSRAQNRPKPAVAVIVKPGISREEWPAR